MDKINLANWNEIFSNTEQEVVFASQRYTDLRLRFEEPGLLSGFVQSVHTPGMQLTEFFLNADQPLRLVDAENTETAESVFVLDGASESRFHNLAAPLRFQKYHHNFQYNHQFGGEHTISAPRFHALTVTYNLDFLKQLLQSDDRRSIGQLAESLHAHKTYLATSRAFSFRGRLAEAIGSIRHCPFTGVTRYLFLESRMMELFVLQMEQTQAVAQHKEDDCCTPADREKLHALRHYIENNYLDSFSLKDLTYKFGLNEFKLKKGYRQLFQTTVFGPVHQLRMQKAKTLLEGRTMNVSQAAFFIGYSNTSSFCTEFKKRFGYSPGKIMLR